MCVLILLIRISKGNPKRLKIAIMGRYVGLIAREAEFVAHRFVKLSCRPYGLIVRSAEGVLSDGLAAMPWRVSPWAQPPCH